MVLEPSFDSTPVCMPFVFGISCVVHCNYLLYTSFCQFTCLSFSVAVGWFFNSKNVCLFSIQKYINHLFNIVMSCTFLKSNMQEVLHNSLFFYFFEWNFLFHSFYCAFLYPLFISFFYVLRIRTTFMLSFFFSRFYSRATYNL